jgi:uncharacterized integral membrane protein (TIGR00697 family)
MPRQRWLPAIAAVFVTSLIIANIIAPISYIFGDVLTEVYGYARARRVIWIGFICNLLAVAAIWISIQLPTAPFWTAGVFKDAEAFQSAYQTILGFTPRLLASSFVAYLIGEFLNSFVLAKMKIATRGRHLWLRTIGSTLIGQLADSIFFFSLAFYGAMPAFALGQLILTQWLLKSGYEALATPITYGVVNFLKRTEKEDHFDRGTNFNPLTWRFFSRRGGHCS